MERIVFITHLGPTVHCSFGPQIKSYLETLEHTYVPRIGPPKHINLLNFSREWLILPRSALYELEGFAVRDMRVFAHNSIQECCRRGGSQPFLYDDQEILVAYICAQLRRTIVAALCLDLRAGYGKTFVAAGIIERLCARTLYIVPTHELAHQVYRDLHATLDRNSDHDSIVIAKSGVQLRDLTMNDTRHVIAIINTVVQVRAPFGAQFALIIFDEAHIYCSKVRSTVFRNTQSRWVIGLSATVDERRDGMDFAIQHYFGRIIHAQNVPGINALNDTAPQFNVHVRKINYTNTSAQNLRHESTNLVFAHYMYEQYARDDVRNNIIFDEARALIAAGHNVFIFSQEREHVSYLAQKIVELEIVPRDLCALFYGGIAADDRANALTRARIICATYSYSGTGISIVRMTAMVLATPRYAQMKQIVGRILRRGSDVAIPRVVVDIIDTTTCLARQWRLRKNIYAFYGAQIHVSRINNNIDQ